MTVLSSLACVFLGKAIEKAHDNIVYIAVQKMSEISHLLESTTKNMEQSPNRTIKQCIVVRHDLHMRCGKQIAQGSHGSIAWLLNLLREGNGVSLITKDQWTWINEGQTKIVLRVDSEQALLDIYQKAKESGVEVHLITDAGLTEFKEPTRTCLAIGPDWADKIDKITGELKLL